MPISKSELFYLRYFRAVAKCEHISRAAEELHITQPALSRAISRMEQEVGAQLFVREANRIHLNHAGRVMLFRVEQIATFRLFLRRRKRRVRKTGSNRGTGSSSIRYGQKTARRWRMHPYNAKCALLPGQIIVSRFGMDVVRFLQRHL